MKRDAKPSLPPELIGVRELMTIFGLGRTRIFELEKRDCLPPSVKLGGGERKWRYREIVDWINSGCPRKCDWRWRPALPVRLDDLIQIKTEEIRALTQEIEEIQSRVDAGERFVHVTRRTT